MFEHAGLVRSRVDFPGALCNAPSSARDYSQAADLERVVIISILNALREECVLLVRAQIVERQNSDAFVRAAGAPQLRRWNSRLSICRSTAG